MKFTISSSLLSQKLSILSGLISSSNALPILDNFLFELDKGSLKLSASDLETTIDVSVDVDSKDSGSVAVPAKILLETLKTFPNQPLTFNIDTKKQAVEILSDVGKYKVVGSDAGDFPKAIQIESPSSANIDSKVLKGAIEKTLFAISSDDLRPIMCGLYLDLNTTGTTFVSTDARKLVKYRCAEMKSKTMTSYVIPKKPLSILQNNLPESAKVKIQYNANNVSFEFDDIIIRTKLIEGKYPNYEAVIPKEGPNKLSVSRSKLLSSIRRVSVYANRNTYQIIFDIKGNNLLIKAEDLDPSNEARENITCEYAGEEMQIAFNSKYIIDILSTLDTEEVLFEMSTANRAALVKPVGEEKKISEDVLMLIMPVMLNS